MLQRGELALGWRMTKPVEVFQDDMREIMKAMLLSSDYIGDGLLVMRIRVPFVYRHSMPEYKDFPLMAPIGDIRLSQEQVGRMNKTWVDLYYRWISDNDGVHTQIRSEGDVYHVAKRVGIETYGLASPTVECVALLRDPGCPFMELCEGALDIFWEESGLIAFGPTIEDSK
ncbi:MAG: hypothetical protein KC877_01850 [Candidatus Kaiserbacteria bacterium]|nr:hypothetical protein [Candidatus Kaiserbacteria bacterium]MCB9815906.1 hypothetical protein [Candidatus Nomurabacteria bacterium]